MLSAEALQIAEERREAKDIGEKERYSNERKESLPQINANK